MNIVGSNILFKIRSEVCSAVLVWLLACAVFTLSVVVVSRPEFAPARVIAGYGALVALLAVVTLFRGKLPYLVRAGTVVALGLAAGVSRLALYGVPYGLLPLAATIIWGALFFGERIAVAIAGVAFASLAAIYLGFVQGFIPLPRTLPPHLSATTWVIGAAVLAATTLGPVIAVSRVSRRLDLERQHAESVSAAKSDFLATMGHELRTPLNAIMGFAEALGLGYAGPPGSARYREYTGHIHSSARHLLTIVDDLLELARTNALQHKVAAEALDVGVELERAVSTVESLSAKAGLTLRLAVDDNLPRALADPTLFQQIVINLLSNAIKFTSVGGSLAVTAGATAEYVHIEVRDTGTGIPAAEIPKLCRPFQQGGHMIAHPHQGSGLGLALAKSFTELQDGRLSIRSTPGVGTTVAIDLPRAAPAAV
jgi:signal transduction histidine kinase